MIDNDQKFSSILLRITKDDALTKGRSQNIYTLSENPSVRSSVEQPSTRKFKEYSRKPPAF